MSTGPLGLYLHVPYCRARCTYCAFYTRADQLSERRRFVNAMITEIRCSAQRGRPELDIPPQEGRRVDSLFFGGGTPSLLAPDDLARLLEEARAAFTLDTDAEVTLEANPETVTPAAARGWIEAGIGRVSLGAQTFHEATLREVGRRHDAAAITRAVELLRAAGLENLNIDLIAGLALAHLEADVESVCLLEPEHVSVYLLESDEAETGAPTGLSRRAARGTWSAPPADWFADAYPRVVERLAAAELARYEISNFARPGRESRHNLKYWLVLDVLGHGPSAHSLIGGRRFHIAADLSAYLAALETGCPPAAVAEEQTPQDRLAEILFLGLRLDAGIDPEAVRRRAGVWLSATQEREVQRLEAAGLLRRSPERWQLTEPGVLLANEVFQAFVP